MRILGIETSCDETAAAVVADGRDTMSNVVASQIDIHSRYGGVVPEIASRQHLLTIVPVVNRAMSEASVSWQDIDGIAVTFGPGLAGSLLVGVNMAKAIALAKQLPITGVNHLEAHIYANWLAPPLRAGPLITTPNLSRDVRFPCLCLIVSGGHSDLVLMRGHGEFEKLGRTRDDAAGEAFDKAARILNLGYPGGPAIERAAISGTPCLSLPRAWLEGTHDFSFSGVKTALWHLVQKERVLTNASLVADAAASFQAAVVDVLVGKTIETAKEFEVRQILLSGGEAANRSLTERLLNSSPLPVLVPPPHLCTDNAAMVAACGYYHFQNGQVDGYDLDVVPSLSLG